MTAIKAGLTTIMDAMMVAAMMRIVPTSRRVSTMTLIMRKSKAALAVAPPQLLPGKAMPPVMLDTVAAHFFRQDKEEACHRRGIIR